MTTCPKCSREFDSEVKYDKHIKLNRCKEPYECLSCNYITKRKTDYTKHLNTKKCKNNNITTLKNFKCERCGVAFRDNHDLQRHLNKKVSCIQQSLIQTSNQMINSNNQTINSNNNQMINSNNNINLNIVLSNYGLGLKDLPNIEQFLLKKAAVAPNLTDEKHIDKFKEELQKEFKNYCSSDEETQKITNTRIVSKFLLDSCIPKKPQLRHSIPLFTSEMFEDILVKENNEMVVLDLQMLNNLIEQLKNLSETDTEQIKECTNDMKVDALLRMIESKLIGVKYTINEYLQKINHLYGCHLCTERFKNNNHLQKHMEETH